MAQEYSAGMIVFNTSSNPMSVLLVHHMNGNHWGFPKGHQEKGETSLETAKRELEEETGVQEVVTLPDISFIDCYTSQSRNKPIEKEVTYFVGTADTTEGSVSDAMKHEIAEARFVPIAEAPALLTYESSKVVLASVLNNEVVKRHLGL